PVGRVGPFSNDERSLVADPVVTLSEQSADVPHGGVVGEGAVPVDRAGSGQNDVQVGGLRCALLLLDYPTQVGRGVSDGGGDWNLLLLFDLLDLFNLFGLRGLFGCGNEVFGGLRHLLGFESGCFGTGGEFGGDGVVGRTERLDHFHRGDGFAVRADLVHFDLAVADAEHPG